MSRIEATRRRREPVVSVVSDFFADSALTVALDLRQPAAYLALLPAAEFGRQVGVDIDWLPVVVAPLKAPTAPAPDDDRSVLHRRRRARALAREIEVYADVQGLVVRDYYRDPDPSAFNLAWLWVRERARARSFDFLSDAFARYWAGRFDPSDGASAERLVDEHGVDAAGFSAWRATDGPASAERVAAALAERGVARAPSYLVGDELFVGRQHLPMIRWILEGRRGRGPI